MSSGSPYHISTFDLVLQASSLSPDFQALQTLKAILGTPGSQTLLELHQSAFSTPRLEARMFCCCFEDPNQPCQKTNELRLDSHAVVCLWCANTAPKSHPPPSTETALCFPFPSSRPSTWQSRSILAQTTTTSEHERECLLHGLTVANYLEPSLVVQPIDLSLAGAYPQPHRLSHPSE